MKKNLGMRLKLSSAPLILWLSLFSYFLFQYSSVNVAGPNIKQDPDEIIYSGCDCMAPSCDQSCPCIQLFGPSYTEDGKLVSSQTTENNSTMNLAKPVLECNASCKCSSQCINRVVQNGLTFQLQIFKTSSKGWGLRTVEKIPVNSFVCEYAGEILTLEDAKLRTHGLTRNDMNYILVVRESLSNGQVIKTYIDPTHIGNVGRFINHSCEPNLYQVIVRIDNEIPKVGLFAARDIEQMEELTYSYGGDVNKVGGQMGSIKGKELQKPCYCRAANCTGALPLDGSLF